MKECIYLFLYFVLTAWVYGEFGFIAVIALIVITFFIMQAITEASDLRIAAEARKHIREMKEKNNGRE